MCAQATQAITFKSDEQFSATKTQKMVEAINQDFEGTRSEINQLSKDKAGIIDRGEVVGAVDISDVDNNNFVTWKESGTRKIGVVIEGELLTIGSA